MFYVMRDLTGGWELTKGENQQGEGGGGPFCQHPDCASGHCSVAAGGGIQKHVPA